MCAWGSPAEDGSSLVRERLKGRVAVGQQWGLGRRARGVKPRSSARVRSASGTFCAIYSYVVLDVRRRAAWGGGECWQDDSIQISYVSMRQGHRERA